MQQLRARKQRSDATLDQRSLVSAAIIRGTSECRSLLNSEPSDSSGTVDAGEDASALGCTGEVALPCK